MEGVSQERNITMETYITRLTLEGDAPKFERHHGVTLMECWIAAVETLGQQERSGTVELWAVAPELPEPTDEKPDLFAKLDVADK